MPIAIPHSRDEPLPDMGLSWRLLVKISVSEDPCSHGLGATPE